MDLKPGRKEMFMAIFDQVRTSIETQPGCLGLEIWESMHEHQYSIWTISSWQSVQHLDQYRESELFRKTWTQVKPLFSSKAQAWTLSSIND